MQNPNPSPRPRPRIAQAPQPPQRPQAAQGPDGPPSPPPDIPRTTEALEALANQRAELKNQLESVMDRREELADQLEDADPAARTGLVERIQILDDRSGRLEREVLLLDDAISAAVASGLGQPEPQEPMTTVHVEEGVPREAVARFMMFEALGFVLLGVIFYKWVMRRAREGFGRSAPEDGRRLDQLQNSVDAIAVEVERISENQRYVTKALNEGLQPEASQKAREEVLIPRKGP